MNHTMHKTQTFGGLGFIQNLSKDNKLHFFLTWKSPIFCYSTRSLATANKNNIMLVPLN